ncbi:MAG: DUF4215 domain-containing protein [Nanoarchaeota archaeon]|nr:DUF4215 domain-containing protein [Nanoarchaeota archaeon]
MINMSQQVKILRRERTKSFLRFRINSKKGISVMIGYILLISIVIGMSVIVYQWIKTYVPRDATDCPDGTSIQIKEISCTTNSTGNYKLNITLKNNGRFNLAGYFIYATTSSEQELATSDLSSKIESGGNLLEDKILFIGDINAMQPNTEVLAIFNLENDIYSVEIAPFRYQEENNKMMFVNCGKAKTKESVNCSEEIPCIPDCMGKQCGDDGCGGNCPPGCDTGFFCDAVRQCISESCTPSPGVCLGLECGLVTNGTCGSVSCGTCTSGFTCNLTRQCEPIPVCGDSIIQEEIGEECDDGNTISEDGCSNQCIVEYCGDGIVQEGIGETCDDGALQNGDGCSNQCIVEFNWVCIGEPSNCQPSGTAQSCPNYCLYLGYNGGYCTNSQGNCVSGGGIYAPEGNQWCTGGAQADTCCCSPIS